MVEWQLCQLGDVIELKRGYDLSKQARISGSVPLVSSSGISDYISEAKVDAPGVVTGRYGTIGQVFYLDEPFWPLNTTLYVRDFKGNDPRFISYFLSQIDFMAYSDKAAVPGINRNHVHQAIVNLPSVSEQSAIASILSALDDKIELNRRMNETLEASARALYRDWFVDFGPTRAKMEGRPAYLVPNLWSLFPDRIDDDGKPEGWEWGVVSDHLELKYGKSLPARERTDGSYPVYGSGGKTGTHNHFIVRGPAVIVGRKGTVGSLYWEDENCYPIDTVFFVSPKRSLVFCYELLSSLPLQDMNTDAAVPGLNRENVYRLELANPTIELINAFASLSTDIRDRIKANVKESRTLAETRDLLLPKLMSGEIGLKDVEAFTREFA